MTALQQYIDLYNEQRDAFAQHSPAALNSLRERALAALEGKQLPRKGQEDYEATSLDDMFAPNYGINVNRIDYDASLADTFKCDVPNLSTRLYCVANDVFRPTRNAAAVSGDGVVVESFAQAAVNHPDVLQRHYGTVANIEQDTAAALNTLLAQDGVLVYVPSGVVAQRPIQLVNVFNASQPMLAARRVLVVLGDGASARMLVCDHTQRSGVSYLSSQVVEIVAGKDSTFDYYDMEESSPGTRRVASAWIRQAQGSNVLVDGITLLNGITRNDYYVQVDGDHAETRLLGMAIASGKQHIDNRTFLRHVAPNCRSYEMFKYVLDDEAVGAFEGKILVEPGCPGTDAYQGNRNLCASPKARMHTKPQLEIYTDDVKCSHGATIGQLDEEALFYMRSRGISLPVARKMLMQAFMSDVIDGVRLDSLKDRLHHLVERRFSGGMAACGECASQCAGGKA